MEASLQTRKKLDPKYFLLLVGWASLFILAIMVLQDDLTGGPGSLQVFYASLTIVCISGPLMGWGVGRKFGRARMGLVLGLVVAVVSFVYVVSQDVIAWESTFERDITSEIHLLGNIVIPFAQSPLSFLMAC